MVIGGRLSVVFFVLTFFFIENPTYANDPTTVTVHVFQKACAVQLREESGEQVEGLSFLVTQEDRERTVRVDNLALEDMQGTWFNRWVSSPVIRFVANRRVNQDNNSERLTKPESFSFQSIRIERATDGYLVVHFTGTSSFAPKYRGEPPATRTLQMAAPAYFVEGDWDAFLKGQKVYIRLTEAGTCVLKNTLIAGNNQVAPYVCPHVENLLTGQYGPEPPFEFDYAQSEIEPHFSGTKSSLSFSGLQLKETIRVTFEPSVEAPPKRSPKAPAELPPSQFHAHTHFVAADKQTTRPGRYHRQ